MIVHNNANMSWVFSLFILSFSDWLYLMALFAYLNISTIQFKMCRISILISRMTKICLKIRPIYILIIVKWAKLLNIYAVSAFRRASEIKFKRNSILMLMSRYFNWELKLLKNQTCVLIPIKWIIIVSAKAL